MGNRKELLKTLHTKGKDGTLVEFIRRSGVEIELVYSKKLVDDQALILFPPNFNTSKQVVQKLGATPLSSKGAVGLSLVDYTTHLVSAIRYASAEDKVAGEAASRNSMERFLRLSDEARMELLYSWNKEMTLLVTDLEGLVPPSGSSPPGGHGGDVVESVSVELPLPGINYLGMDIGSPF